MIKRFLIADDHAIFREGIKQVIASTSGQAMVEEAATGVEAVKKVAANRYDLVLLDISMPGRNGLDILMELKRIRPEVAVVMLSMYPEEQYAIRAFRAGASGYVTKGCSPGELLTAMQRVMSGKKYVSPALAEVLVSTEGGGEKPLHMDLSNREYQVLCMLASGKTLSRVAAELTLSIKTVSTHRAHLLKKMNLQNNAELTRYALEHQLV
ncbi:MAG: response regulator transcription factor [Desulfuromonadales bacterium]|nr:response regulator transcription factor [Desulfuromonadales bacterium]